MYLIQIFLPLRDNQQHRFAHSEYEQVEEILIRHFDGFTAHRQAPATGLWKNPDAEVEEDEVVIYEVMTEKVDRKWWNEYRDRLEKQFRQEKVLIRAQTVEVL